MKRVTTRNRALTLKDVAKQKWCVHLLVCSNNCEGGNNCEAAARGSDNWRGSNNGRQQQLGGQQLATGAIIGGVAIIEGPHNYFCSSSYRCPSNCCCPPIMLPSQCCCLHNVAAFTMLLPVTALITAVIRDTTIAYADRFTDGLTGLRTDLRTVRKRHVTRKELYKTVRELLASFPFSFFLSFRFLYLELPIVKVVAHFMRDSYLD
jgi:hypothetical protein